MTDKHPTSESFKVHEPQSPSADARSLSTTYAQRFDRVLESVQSWTPRRNRTEALTPCWPEWGDRFVPGSGLMVLGRATNGFMNGFAASETESEERRFAKDTAQITAHVLPV